MAKNTFQIAQARELAKLQKKVKEIVPEVYACFAKALIEEGRTPEEVGELFAHTQRLWNENVDNMEDMITWVADTVGIEVRGEEYV